MHMAGHIHVRTIHALLDGRLDAPQARRVESHLWRCGECRALREEYAALQTALRWYGADPPVPPEGYWEGFWRRWPLEGRVSALDEPPVAKRASVARRIAPAVALAASVTLIAGVWWTNRGPVDETPLPVRAPTAVSSDWAADYEFFEQVTVAVGSVDPMSKGIVLASLAEAP